MIRRAQRTGINRVTRFGSNAKMKNTRQSRARTRARPGPGNFITHKYLARSRLKSQIFLLRAAEFISGRALIKCVPVTR